MDNNIPLSVPGVADIEKAVPLDRASERNEVALPDDDEGLTIDRAANIFADLTVEQWRQENLHGKGSPEAQVVHQAATWMLRLVGLLKLEQGSAS